MEYMPLVFSLTFITVAVVSIYWSWQIVKLNLQELVKKIFVITCIALSVWSFGFAMANLSQSLETALLWRRFSALGWTSIFSVILHFLMLITKEKQGVGLPRYLLIIYIPALINMYIFALSNNMAIIQYNDWSVKRHIPIM